MIDLDDVVGLDFETYGAVNIMKHGLDRYVNDSTFTPLIGSCVSGSRGVVSLDFVAHGESAKAELHDNIQGMLVAGHNVAFEFEVLKHLGLERVPKGYIDSAVVARAAGAASSLSAASSQLLENYKLDSGSHLIKLFSVPGAYQEGNGSLDFEPQIVADNLDEWDEFRVYCDQDASLSLELVEQYGQVLTYEELEYWRISLEMNQVGWPVDLEAVLEMQRRYEDNKAWALANFRLRCNADKLNLNSLKQLKEWCGDRGVRASSFDEKHVASMLKTLHKRMATGGLTQVQDIGYHEVIQLLNAKQVMGGSSLKKLQTILDYVGEDGRLRHQYMHAGAGQTLRTSGKSVQLQNLKRLTSAREMDDLDDEASEWSNTELAENLRQVFTSSDPNGRLIVGDFSSVESRGLAYLAGEQWKLTEYKHGRDLYKVLAATMFTGATYETVTKEQRQTGKVGELSCGYGAGPGAVVEFAKNMGVELSDGEATKLVSDWRTANPMIVNLWGGLDEMLKDTVTKGDRAVRALGSGLRLIIEPVAKPPSLEKMHPSSRSVVVVLSFQGRIVMKRYFHGCYVRGRSICYYRPSERKSGDPWSKDFMHPKTKQRTHYSIYGGKLAGILTQSFCRELFFDRAVAVAKWADGCDNVTLIGQFHDELVLDWRPPAVGTYPQLDVAMVCIEEAMSSPPAWAWDFPLAADVKCDYRYTK